MTATSSATHAASTTPFFSRPLPQQKSFADKIFSAEQSTAKASLFKRVTTAFWGKLKNCIHKIVQIVLAPFKAIASLFRWLIVGSKTTTVPSQPKPAEKPIKRLVEPVQKPAGKPISVSSAQPVSKSTPSQKPASAPSTQPVAEPEPQEIRTFQAWGTISPSETLEAKACVISATFHALWKQLANGKTFINISLEVLMNLSKDLGISIAKNNPEDGSALRAHFPHIQSLELKSPPILTTETLQTHLSNTQGLAGTLCYSLKEEDVGHSSFILFDGVNQQPGIFYLGFLAKTDAGLRPTIKIFSTPEEAVKEVRAHFPPNRTLFLQPYQFQSEVPPQNERSDSSETRETSAEDSMDQAAPEPSHIRKDPLAILSSLNPEDTREVQEKGTFSGKTFISFFSDTSTIEKFHRTPHIRNEEGCFTHSDFFPSPFCTFYTLRCLWTALERGLILTRDTAGDFIDSVIENAFTEASKSGNLSRGVYLYKSLEAFPQFKVDDRFSQFEENRKSLEIGGDFKGHFEDAMQAFSQKKGEITGFIFEHCLTGDLRFVLFDNRGEESIGYIGFKNKKSRDGIYVPTIQVTTPHRISLILGKFLNRRHNDYSLLPLTLREQASSETSKPEEKKE